jgi:hypothetical protein
LYLFEEKHDWFENVYPIGWHPLTGLPVVGWIAYIADCCEIFETQ